MTITYEEFDATPATIFDALKTKILANPHWTDQGVVQVSTTSTANTVSASTSITVASSAGFEVGQLVVLNPGTGSEVYRTITSIPSGTQILMDTTWGAVYASGAVLRTRNTVLKSTSDRGAELIVDLEGGDATTVGKLGLAVYRQWTTGTTPSGAMDAKTYLLYWKVTATGTMTMPIHVTLSVGKNHLFIGAEGPRGHETGTQNITYGSARNYFALCDLIPYHAADAVPAAIAVGVNTAVPSTGSNSHQVYVSRDAANTVSWTSGRLASLDWPTLGTTDVVTLNRDCTIDGKTYLFPYVMASEREGLRGRLSSFYYCGTTAPTPLTDLPEAVGSKVTYDGIVYKLLAVNKGDGTNNTWGPFGTSANSGAVTRSTVVAVPFAVAV